MKTSPSELPFGSFLVYPTRGHTELCQRVKRAEIAIKEDRLGPRPPERMPEYAARRLSEMPEANTLRAFFPPDAVLVPVPRSGVRQKGALWPAHRVAEALVAHGLGREIADLLERHDAVRKSATAAVRPTPEDHRASLRVQLPRFATTGPIVLVDDVVTRGATLLGSAWRVKEALPGAELSAFAMARTLSFEEEIGSAVAPCLGRIRWDGKHVSREP